MLALSVVDLSALVKVKKTLAFRFLQQKPFKTSLASESRQGSKSKLPHEDEFMPRNIHYNNSLIFNYYLEFHIQNK